MKRFIIIYILSIFLNVALNAQISHGGEPLSFGQISLKSASVFSTPVYDYQKMLLEDSKSDRSKPFRYGKLHEVSLSPENSGTWSQNSDGAKIWQLRIKSKNAYSIGLIFNKFRLSKSSRMFVFSSDKKTIIGSFTAENNKPNNWFSTIPVAGEDIIVELDVETNEEYGELNISGIAHDYKNAFGLKTGFRDSESCNVNINCPEGADWQLEKRSVVKYSYGTRGDLYFCTGVLVNNTSFDRKPYLLTAAHCISSQATASTAIFMFNYETFNCVSTIEPSYKSISSATLIATGGTLDFTLMQLSDNPPATYNAYFAGWNRSTTPAKSTVTIHHPQGDVKKISKDYDPPVIGNYGSGYASNSHWNIKAWDLGTTEGGSSGSPLFDQNHRIVGNLTGGDASCSYNYNDYYSRFDKNWNFNNETNKQLRAWLDPKNTGIEVLEGFDPNSIALGTDIGIVQIINPKNSICANSEIIPELTIQNNGTVDLTNATIGYKVNNGTTISKVWTGNLKTWETANIKLQAFNAPAGNVTFEAFSSMPNGGSDSNITNDTLRSSFLGEEPINDISIEGDLEICGQLFQGEYSTSIPGKYHWNVVGGTVVDGDTTQLVSVRWDDWGDRYVNLNVTNLCNSFDAVPVKIEVVEQSLQLELNTGTNGESVCWSLEDCDGNIIYEKCGLLSNEKYTENLCVSKGCYQFKIKSLSNGVNNYKLLNLVNDEVITESSSIHENVNEQFALEATKNKASFNLYPNPVRDELVIEASFKELYTDSKFAIYKTDGGIVIPFNLLDERKTIDISHLPKGLYIIEIISPYGKYSKKIVKP